MRAAPPEAGGSPRALFRQCAPCVPADWTDTANHAKDGAADGMLAIQMHFSDEKTKRWVPGSFWRWRTIAVKELP